MSETLNILLLEDEHLDATLVRRALRKDFPELTLRHVQTKGEYLDRLNSERFDLVLSDNSIPGCEGMKAFHLAHQHQPRAVFISISGYSDPGRDLHGLRALGIEHVLNKSDLSQLPAVIAQAMHKRMDVPDEAARLLRGYERLVGVVRDLSHARALNEIMAIVRRAARELTGADGATFVLREGEQCYYADEDAIGPLWKGQRFPMDSCISGWAMKHRQPAVVEDIFTDLRIPVSAYEPTFVRSVVMVPIRSLDPIGAIGNYWKQRRLPDVREVRLLQALADTTAVALENATVYRELDARVRERTADLEAFTYAVSHDLRAPIRHLQGYASMLVEDHAEQLDDDARDKVQRLADTSIHMGEMVDGLLSLSRTAQLPLRRQPVDLSELARQVAAACQAEASRAVDFVASPAVMVQGDPALLRNVLQNLIGNAMKFSSKNEAPRIEFGVMAQASGEAVYFVRDNGVGFDPSSSSKLFGVFQRLHAESEFPGTGIGLASVQRIVQKHGGKVWASGAPGRGACFYFTLGEENA